MVVAGVGVGANLGDAPATVRAALRALAELPGCRLRAASRLYRTPAWGDPDQPDFINAAAALETASSAPALLEQLLAVEQAFGRVRLPGERWRPRTLDLDLLLYGDQVVDLPQLKVPHPFLHQRAFALMPLSEVLPGAVIPGRGTLADALAAVETCGIAPIGG
ncbi:2-amino-4-hydroxy-6-hydroxymethyldihydropteridine diphosphokinase [Stenotrophomonas mori]|uniref:2-amino-4-hydroxy-6-hydroxymethyldihydropteridine pyrophosphokinase n=1 Tax=Stenotrophomonas mori TaxID=2871096 RepID=A0ABT0SF37_9GAMM|nr:2-amino-4-hydroxy-6-hydroxymethyldihydropteridine diphosphokinase [Stenotrophomonas mori]MCL7713937.1 2-amino-4-hydroxy-6-hydroxymethyldihydropteridine diphosphokinase [Stenotrophomonas mori]